MNCLVKKGREYISVEEKLSWVKEERRLSLFLCANIQEKHPGIFLKMLGGKLRIVIVEILDFFLVKT